MVTYFSKYYAYRTFVENENDGKVNWPTNSAGMFVAVNTSEPNPYGEYPGYRILPGENYQSKLRADNQRDAHVFS